MQVVFTDLDGTLIDFHDYSYDKSEAALRRLKENSIPVIFNTGKTPAENFYYREKLGIADPFITENGSAIYIPEGYFDFEFDYSLRKDGFLVIELGAGYGRIISALNSINSAEGWSIRGRSAMSVDEVARDAGMPAELARLARMREYSESFRFGGDTGKLSEAAAGFSMKIIHGGKYLNLVGEGADKGRAALRLLELYRKIYPGIRSVGIGDSSNDIPLLKVVDLPVLVSSERVSFPGARLTGAEGPEGFSEAVERFILPGS